MASLQGKVIAITGAASGIGAATSRLAASRGATLALCDVNDSALQKLVEELSSSGTKVTGQRVDVAKSDEVDAWITSIVSSHGALHGAANIAGVEAPPGGKIFANITDISNESWDFILGVNLTGLFYCLRAELRAMTEGAAILNVASIAGLMGRPGIGAYGASKHGVVGLTRTAAKEMGGKGIRVNALAPGPIDTPMLGRLLSDGGSTGSATTNTYKTLPLQRLGTAEDMARMIVFALSDESSYTTGAVFSADGGVAC